ncbi:MAG: YbaK/EbsC family protein [Pseudomonadota bacterium]
MRIQETLGDDFEVLEFDAGTRTATDAAAAIGYTVSQIAKSLVFKAVETKRPVLVITSGSERIDEEKVSALLGEPIEPATAEFVRERTGFAIGGVPPLAHREQPIAFIDKTLLGFETIWAAAGTPNAVFRLNPKDLIRLSGGTVSDVKV